jgi:NAD(P)-dependent dehydrogenase (short-subunit alcohol dehydrogenase family)
MAERFIALGHLVLGCGRSPEAIEELRRQFPGRHDFAVVDVAQNEQVRLWAERLLNDHGPPDLLVNNAAVMNQKASLWTISATEFDSLIDVNIKGVANVIRHFVPAMVARERGVIVNFSSGWGRTTAPKVAPYCATKFAMEGLTQALAHELPAGMAAVPLNPGIIDTAMLRIAFGSRAGSYPDADTWAHSAVDYILSLGPSDNGEPRDVPQS